MTNLAIAHARLRNSRLVGERLPSPADVVRWFGAVQSQDLPGAFWAVAQRMPPGTTVADVEGAFDTGSIVRTHALRPTWHFLAPEELRWIQELTAARVHRANGTLHRRLGLTDADFARVEPLFRTALADGRALSRDELREVAEPAGLDLSDPLVTTYLAMHAELDALICSGPRRGKVITYQLVDDRVPAGPGRARHDALRELVTRYFRSHGPATAQDASWWSGLTVGDIRRGLELAGDEVEQRTIGGTVYAAALGSFEPEPALIPEPFVRLLSNYDEYLGSYADYSPIVDSSFPKPRNVADVLGSHIVIRDGLVVGGWRRELRPKSATVRVRLLTELGAAERDALEVEVDAVGRFFGLPVELEVTRI